MIRYIVDYLIRTGRQEEARGLARARGVEVSPKEEEGKRERGWDAS